MMYPSFFVVEITNRCNLVCPACPWHTCMTRSIKDMTLEEFEVVFEKIKPYAKEICLYLMGEPFLNKELKDIVSLIKKDNKKVIISSNGMLINENIDWIKKTDIDVLQIALDGFSKETHEAYRVGSDFDKIIENLKCLSEYKNTHLQNTEIAIQTLINKYNENEISLIENFSRESGFTFHTKKMYYGKNEIVREKNYSKFKPIDVDSIRNPGKNYYTVHGNCPELEKAVILSNGVVVVCCVDFDGVTSYGNIFESSFEEIWQSEKRKFFLESFNNKQCEFCEKCDMV